MLKRFCASLFLVFLCSFAAYAEESSGVIYGKDHAYILSAPRGWVLDNASGVGHGYHAVFYPEGLSWQESETLMYTSVHPYAEDETINDVIEADIRSLEEEYPGIVIDRRNEIKIDGKIARVFYFYGGAYGSFDVAVYIPELKVAVKAVLTSKSENAFKAGIAPFADLLSSYAFITDDVIFKAGESDDLFY